MGSSGTLMGGSVLGIRRETAAPPPQYITFVEKTPNYAAAATAGASRPPAAPVLDGTGTNAGMEAARQNERRHAEARRYQSRDVYTSGLGATGLAGTRTEELLAGNRPY